MAHLYKPPVCVRPAGLHGAAAPVRCAHSAAARLNPHRQRAFFWLGFMAIYHFSAQMIKRSDGRSAVAAAAYRAAEKLTDARTGTVADFTKKSGVAFTHILLPADAPADYADRSTLWNAVERAETRSNSQVAREIDIALPVELSPHQQRDLILGFVQQVFVDAGMCADVAIHDIYSGNPHAHVMLTTRNVDRTGFTTKNRDWNDKKLLTQWREQWAEHANNALEQAGHAERIDHRTLLEQGITDREPQVHLGPARHAMKRRGVTLTSVAPQLERQRLRRAAQDAAAAKIAEAEAQARVDFLSAQLDDIQAQRRENHEQRIDAIRAAIAAAEQREQSIRERIGSVTADTARGEKIVRQQREKITIAERHEQDVRERISAATAAIERATGAVATVSRAVSRAVGAVTGSISQWRERRTAQRRADAEIAQITAEIDQITDAITDAQQRYRSATDADRIINAHLRSVVERVERTRGEIARAEPLAATPDQRAEIERLAKNIRSARALSGVYMRSADALKAARERYDQRHAAVQPRPRPTTPAPTQYNRPKG